MSDIVSTENTFCFPVCNKCKHHLGGDKCYAFDKIPKEILLGENKHDKILLHQKNDIVFEKKNRTHLAQVFQKIMIWRKTTGLCLVVT